jgi:hypothetical protein
VRTTAGPQAPETRRTLFDHASELHRQAPDLPLPRDGEPFPDDHAHRGVPRPKFPKHQVREGMDVAGLLAEHFASPHAQPHELALAFHGLYVPIHPNGHIDFAAENADRDRVLDTGRWLVRNGADRCAVTVGLAILGAVGNDAEDTPLVQTIGLLSNRFGPLAARALKQVDASAQALLWLAERVEGWGRVYVIEALCSLRDQATFQGRSGELWTATATSRAASHTSAAWNTSRALYIETLSSDAWGDEARSAVERGDRLVAWIAKDVAPELGLPWAAASAEEWRKERPSTPHQQPGGPEHPPARHASVRRRCPARSRRVQRAYRRAPGGRRRFSRVTAMSVPGSATRCRLWRTFDVAAVNARSGSGNG